MSNVDVAMMEEEENIINELHFLSKLSFYSLHILQVSHLSISLVLLFLVFIENLSFDSHAAHVLPKLKRQIKPEETEN